jgi:hypothetical protein
LFSFVCRALVKFDRWQPNQRKIVAGSVRTMESYQITAWASSSENVVPLAPPIVARAATVVLLQLCAADLVG